MNLVRWIPETGAGMEHLVVRREGDSFVAHGVVIGERDAPIDVAYVHIPGLQVEKAAQAYTRLGSHAYRFESLADGFQAELEVDDDGFVVRYPGLFRRLGQGSTTQPNCRRAY